MVPAVMIPYEYAQLQTFLKQIPTIFVKQVFPDCYEESENVVRWENKKRTTMNDTKNANNSFMMHLVQTLDGTATTCDDLTKLGLVVTYGKGHHGGNAQLKSHHGLIKVVEADDKGCVCWNMSHTIKTKICKVRVDSTSVNASSKILSRLQACKFLQGTAQLFLHLHTLLENHNSTL